MSTHKDDEIIGYVPRDKLEQLNALCSKPGITADPDRTLYAGLLGQLQWGRRGPLEQDPTKKQPIPYILCTRDDHVWIMQRKQAQGETRLHGKLSLGVGGHLSALADQESDDPIREGALRELNEEVRLDGAPLASLTWSYLGVLNDDSNDVGRVHVGVVFHLELPHGAELEVKESEKHEGRWVRWDALDYARLETWSQLVADVMKR